LDEGALSHGSQDRWGNSIKTKQKDTVQLIFQNLDGISQTTESGDMKLTLLWEWITQSVIDIFAFVEHGTYWDLITYQAHLPQKMRGWWEAVQWSIGYNCLVKHAMVY